MFSLRVLPALHGDALWLDYGAGSDVYSLLIDGGPSSNETLNTLHSLVRGASRLTLIVVTHIDADHITGILTMFENRGILLTPEDVWFNGWHHLPSDLLGAPQGERLGAAITRRRCPWNQAFGGGAVVTSDQGHLPRVELPGGLTLTVLSPTLKELAELRPVWKREVEKAGMVPGLEAEKPDVQPDRLGDGEVDLGELKGRPFEEDSSIANGTSIAVLVEYDKRAVLLTGDAHPAILTAQLRRLADQRKVSRVAIDLCKVPHHGSRHNLSNELIDAIDCERWLFSTNGAIYQHPDPEALARLVFHRPGAQLIFNYRSDTTNRYDSSRLQRRFRYRTLYPTGEAGLILHL